MKPKYFLYDKGFEKKFEKYKKQLADAEIQRLKSKFAIFKENIFDKRLKTHKLKGELSDYYAFSISYSERIIFKVLKDEGIFFIDIGSHGICY
jgi:addiction module RelE/StbE family toxin